MHCQVIRHPVATYTAVLWLHSHGTKWKTGERYSGSAPTVQIPCNIPSCTHNKLKENRNTGNYR